MTFDYVRYSDTVARPVIELEVGYKGVTVTYNTLVDSGADISVFNTELAAVLGIDLESGVPAEVLGATGEVMTVYVHLVTLTVGGYSFEAQVAFMDSESPYGLAGQRGFFDNFVVTFDRQAGQVRLAHVGDELD